MNLTTTGSQTGEHEKPDPWEKRRNQRNEKEQKENEEQKIASHFAHPSDALHHQWYVMGAFIAFLQEHRS